MTEQRWGPVHVQPDESASLLGVPYRITSEGFFEIYVNLGAANPLKSRSPPPANINYLCVYYFNRSH